MPKRKTTPAPTVAPSAASTATNPPPTPQLQMIPAIYREPPATVQALPHLGPTPEPVPIPNTPMPEQPKPTRQGPEDALGNEPTLHDYTGRIGGSDYRPHSGHVPQTASTPVD